MKITIKDVADSAGVSPTSVSLVLNDKPNNLSVETRNRIIDTAKKLNYQPNFFAKSLKTNITNLIGLLLPSLTNPFFANLASYMNLFAKKSGFSLIIIEIDHELNDIQSVMDTFTQFQVDGIIVVLSSFHQDSINLIQNSGIPFVTTDTQFNNNSSVNIDNQYGGYIAGNYLVDMGHKRIGCFTGPKDSDSSNERLIGFKSSKTSNLESFYYEGNYGIGNEDKALDYFISNNCTAIFALNDMMAYGLYKAARKMNLSIPKDISIIGFDDINFNEVLYPELSTIGQPLDYIAKESIQLIVKMVDNPKIIENINIKPKLIERNSVKKIN